MRSMSRWANRAWAAWAVSAVSTSKSLFFFVFNDTATTEIYTLSLHDALPISPADETPVGRTHRHSGTSVGAGQHPRSEEHTSELQSRPHLVCRLLLEKKK